MARTDKRIETAFAALSEELDHDTYPLTVDEQGEVAILLAWTWPADPAEAGRTLGRLIRTVVSNTQDAAVICDCTGGGHIDWDFSS